MIKCLYDCFKHWASNGSVYIISDLHFNDSDCKLMDSSWISPEEHIEILNSKVKKSDTLIVLGDVGDFSYIPKIKAKNKILIKGNHDSGSSNYKEHSEARFYIKNGEKVEYSASNGMFTEVYDGPVFISDKILLSHEPIDFPFAVNIHGYCHGGKFRYENHINVASDVCNFVPINLGKEIDGGLLSGIKTIHRETIDNASKNTIHKKNI